MQADAADACGSNFPARVTDPGELRKTLVKLAEEARAKVPVAH